MSVIFARLFKIPFQASFVISDAYRLNYDNELFGAFPHRNQVKLAGKFKISKDLI